MQLTVDFNAGAQNQSEGDGPTLCNIKEMVGAAGFEPTTPTPPVWCATRLRYAPTERGADYNDGALAKQRSGSGSLRQSGAQGIP